MKFESLIHWSWLPFSFCQESGSKTSVHLEKFEDFSQNSFKVTIARVQQAALRNAGGRLPTPGEQLEMINRRREKKKARRGNANHISNSELNFVIYCFYLEWSLPM